MSRSRTHVVASATDASTLLRPEHPGINHKRVYRLYKAADLAVRRRRKAKRPMSERVPLQAASLVNEAWSMDFVSEPAAPALIVDVLAERVRAACARVFRPAAFASAAFKSQTVMAWEAMPLDQQLTDPRADGVLDHIDVSAETSERLRLRRSTKSVAVLVARAVWIGPAQGWLRWDVREALSIHAGPRDVDRAIRRALDDPRYFFRCPSCGRHLPRDYEHGESECLLCTAGPVIH